MLPLECLFVCGVLVLRNIHARGADIVTRTCVGVVFLTASHGVLAPALVFGPAKGQAPYFARRLDALKGGEGFQKNFLLECGLVFFAGRVAEWKIKEEATRGSHGTRDAKCAGQAKRGDSFFFQGSGYQSDRLMTDRSDRDKKSDVGALIAYLLHDLGRQLLLDATG
jgi:hypothetical protein